MQRLVEFARQRAAQGSAASTLTQDAIVPDTFCDRGRTANGYLSSDQTKRLKLLGLGRTRPLSGGRHKPFDRCCLRRRQADAGNSEL